MSLLLGLLTVGYVGGLFLFGVLNFVALGMSKVVTKRDVGWAVGSTIVWPLTLLYLLVSSSRADS